jgi:tetratricopeptide (TPR) repeat protein
MNRTSEVLAIISVCAGLATLAVRPAPAQSFGASKQKVLLQRKLPALVHLPGNSIKVSVTSGDFDGALPYDFQALLETELLKDDPDLREDDHPQTIINCRITQYSQPQVITTLGPAVALTQNAPKTQQFERITGTLSVAFQAKTAAGLTLISDNVTSKYDEQFDGSGISTSHGVMGSLTGTWSKLKGQKNDENTPPTPAELRSRLILDAVQQIAEHIVNTNETIEVFLAKQNGALDEGDKDAQAGLWERALETFETATPSSKPEDDAYRVYNIGVAYEALAYSAEDQKSAVKYLDQAAINYGKAVDAKPNEKYFLDPQKRIETAIAHYRELQIQSEQAQKAKEAEAAAQANPTPPAPAPSSAASPRGLTNAQVLALVKAGVDEETVIHAIRGAEAVNFDLSPAAEKSLTSSGISARILAAMKTQAARKAVVAKAPAHKGLTNAQVITMVKAGMDEETIVNAIRGADAIDFDLSPDGERQLKSGGVSIRVLTAMKARATKRPAAYARPVAER